MLSAQTSKTMTGLEPSAWDLLVNIGTTAGALLTILTILVWLVRPRLKQLLGDTKETRQQVSQLNNGTHLRDMVRRIDTNISHNENRITRIEANLREHLLYHERSQHERQ